VNSVSGELPPNQVWGKRFVIYAALGIPRVRPEDWSFKIDGLVDTPLEFTYDQMLAMPQTGYVKSFHCLLPGSVVYANPEPKRIEDVVPGDTIIGGDGRGHRVRRLIRKEHRGSVVGIKAAYLPPVAVTPEHPVLVVKGHPGVGKTRSKRRQKTFASNPSPAWVRADQLSLGDYVFFPKYREVSRRKFARIGRNRVEIDERLASVLGWYVAEGSGSDSVGRNVAFSLGSEDGGEVDILRNDLKDLFGAKTSVYGNDNGTLRRVVITSSETTELAPTLKRWCGKDAESKKIPDFILNARIEILRAFLVSYFKGDGYAPLNTGKFDRRSDFIDNTTSSMTLAYQLILAFSKLGIPAELVGHPGSVKDGYSVRVRGDKVKLLLPDFPSLNKINRFHYSENPDGFYFPIRRLWTEQYSGQVYDFQAPGFTMLSPFVTQDCVTKWSIKDARWEGVALRGLLDQAKVRPEAKWVMFHCVDGYTAPVPLEYAMRDDALLAFKVNGNPLSAEQGFPARPFFPNLYGWKSAKWANRMELMPAYKDGYWEMYGYHERADVWEEERFKGGWGKAILRRAFGTA
jgi:DMSO/TMAO reductase YedYZ molybdopterin-dependent catalytic subunit